MTKPRIKCKNPMSADLETMADLSAVAVAIGKQPRRLYFAFRIERTAEGARFPIALTPLCFTPEKVSAAAFEAKASGVEEIGIAGTVQGYDLDDLSDAVVFDLHEQEAAAERAEWERKK